MSGRANPDGSLPARQESRDRAASRSEWRVRRDSSPERKRPTYSDFRRAPPAADCYRPRSSTANVVPSVNHKKRRRESAGSSSYRSRSRDSRITDLRHTFRREQRGSSPPYRRDHRDDYFDRVRSRSRGREDYDSMYQSPSNRASGKSSRRPHGPNSPESPQAHRGSYFGNLTWTKPSSSPARPPSGPTSETLNSCSMSPVHQSNPKVIPPKPTVEVNGIKGVPTGPSRMTHRPVDEAVKRAPHLFISSVDVPVLGGTKNHITKLIQRFNPHEVHMDDTGYFVSFLDTRKGLMDMTRCEKYHRATNTLLFATYPLRMKIYPKGLPTDLQGQTLSMISDVNHNPSTEADQSANPSLWPSTKQMSHTALTDATNVENENNPTNPTLERSQGQMEASDSTEQQLCQIPLTDVNRELSLAARTFPSLAASRSDRDEVSSISERGSEISGTSTAERRSCHVCKRKFGQDSMTKCNSCPRRYHSHCHPGPVIREARWQCYRCLRKGVQLKIPSPYTSEFEQQIKSADNGRLSPSHEPLGVLQTLRKPEDGEALMPPVSKDRAAESAENQLFSEQSLYPRTSNQETTTSGEHKSADSFQQMQIGDAVEIISTEPFKGAEPWGKSDRCKNLDQDKALNSTVTGSEDANNANSQLIQAQDLVEKSFSGRIQSDAAAASANKHKAPKINFLKRKILSSQPGTLSPSTDPQNDMLSGLPAAVETSVDQDAEHTCGDIASDFPGTRSLHITDEVKSTDFTIQGLELITTQNTANHAAGNERTHSSIVLKSPSDIVLQQVKARPTKTDLTRCENCRIRKIPKNPLGKSLCSKCKRANHAAFTEVPHKSDNALFNNASQKASDAERESTASISEVQRTSNERRVEPDRQDESFDDVQMEMSQAPTFERPVACPTCRRRHQKCRHQTVPSKSTNASKLDAPRQPYITAGHDSTDSAQLVTSVAISNEGHSRSMNDHGGADNIDDNPVSYNIDAEGKGLSTPGKNKNPRGGDIPNTTTNNLQGRTTRSKPQHRRRSAVKDDLGNSDDRAPGTYGRLIGMALCAAPRHRAQAVSVRDWVAKNIPNYDLRQGKWAAGIMATMNLNTHGRSGKPFMKRTEWKEGDGGVRESPWYELLPGLYDQLEHWDFELKKPIGPLKSSMELSFESASGNIEFEPGHDRHEPDNSASDSGLEGNEALAEHSRRENSFQSEHDNDAMEVDEQSISNTYSENSSSDGGSSKRKHTIPSTTRSSQATEHTTGVDGLLRPPINQTGPDRRDDTERVHGLSDETYFDEVSLRNMIRQEMTIVDTSAQSLRQVWPDRHPNNVFDEKRKIAEITGRRSRKDLFGKNPLHSRLGRATPAEPLGARPLSHVKIQMTPRHLRDRGLVESGPFMEVPCDTLQEFLLPGVVDELVLGIQHDQLVFRSKNSRKRDVYKTGI